MRVRVVGLDLLRVSGSVPLLTWKPVLSKDVDCLPMVIPGNAIHYSKIRRD